MAYVAPTSDDLIERWPAFTDVDVDRIDYWLDEAAIECAAFPDDDRAKAELAYAAHMLVGEGVLSGTGAAPLPAGAVSFRSGTFAASLSESVASRTGFATTIYGQEFVRLRRRAFAGPQLMGYGCA